MPAENFPMSDQEGKRVSFSDPQSGYELVLRDEAADPAILAHFRTPEGVIVTGRTLEDYRRLLPQAFPVDPNAQYLEIGAGLSDFVPSLTEQAGGLPPIVVDVAQYDRMEALLGHALTLPDAPPLVAARRETLERLLHNCQTMRDGTRVRLYNALLGQTLSRHPELRASADVVIDVQGAVRYVATETPQVSRSGVTTQMVEAAAQKVERLERQLLKAGGVYLTTIEH